MAIVETTVPPAETTLRCIRNLLTGWANQTKAVQDNVRQLVWKNQYGLSPQEVFDLLGADGKELNALMGVVESAVKTVGCDLTGVEDFVPAEKSLVEAVDGRVTIVLKKV